MEPDSFAERERSLEDEFFFRVDQELMQQLRQRLDFEEQERALEAATGISDRSVIDELLQIGVRPESLLALTLVPAVAVAWADGHIETAERDALLRAAEAVGLHPSSAAFALFESWLGHRPPELLNTAWRDYIRALRPVIAESSFGSLRQDCLQRARAIAEAAGGFLGMHSVSQTEQAALQALEQAFTDCAASESAG